MTDPRTAPTRTDLPVIAPSSVEPTGTAPLHDYQIMTLKWACGHEYSWLSEDGKTIVMSCPKCTPYPSPDDKSSTEVLTLTRKEAACVIAGFVALVAGCVWLSGMALGWWG